MTLVGARIVGTLNVLIGLLLVEGGVLEFLVYWGRDPRAVAVGMAGATAAAVLLTSGVALWTRRAFARRALRWGAGAMLPSHILGFALGYMGWTILPLGILYPAYLLVAAWRRPGFGLPAQPTTGGKSPVGNPPSSNSARITSMRAMRLRQA